MDIAHPASPASSQCTQTSKQTEWIALSGKQVERLRWLRYGQIRLQCTRITHCLRNRENSCNAPLLTDQTTVHIYQTLSEKPVELLQCPLIDRSGHNAHVSRYNAHVSLQCTCIPTMHMYHDTMHMFHYNAHVSLQCTCITIQCTCVTTMHMYHNNAHAPRYNAHALLQCPHTDKSD